MGAMEDLPYCLVHNGNIISTVNNNAVCESESNQLKEFLGPTFNTSLVIQGIANNHN